MYLCCEISWTAGITSLSLRWLMCKLRRQEESPGAIFLWCLVFPFECLWWYFENTNIKGFAGKLLAESPPWMGKSAFQCSVLGPCTLDCTQEMVCITTTIKFPVPTVNFWSGLHITSGVSLHLLKLMYFSQVRLASQQPVYLMQYFSLSVIYLDFWWLVS